jgi:hypothetical protein
LKLQRLQNRVLHATGNIDSCTPVREMHVAFNITKLRRIQAEVALNNVIPIVRGIGQGEP